MKKIRIGTRKSPLAIWQAKKISKKLNALGYETQIISSQSLGDKNQKTPIYHMGIVGVFTKTLDTAILNNEIDIAVHSLKDVPTILADGLVISAVLERDFSQDVLIRNPNKIDKKNQFEKLKIGTCSVRRRAFWRSIYAEVEFCSIRGNVQTRLNKLVEENLDGTIFSLAGIKRLNLDLEYETLDFIIPAPSQGVISITSRIEDVQLNEILKQINHKQTYICTRIEREILKELEGGCSAPIGIYSKIIDDELYLKCGIVSIDGSKKIILEEKMPLEKSKDLIRTIVMKAKEKGAMKLIREIRTNCYNKETDNPQSHPKCEYPR